MKPVLLLIPGMFNTAAIWHAVLPLLQEHVDVRLADVLTQDSIAGMATDAWRQVENLPPGTPLVVCGFSMGGYVALELLAARPDAVHALAMVDSSARPETPETMVVREKTIAALERNFAKVVDGTILFSLHPDNHQNTALVDGMRAMMHEVGAEAAIRQTRAIIGRADQRARLAQVRIPVLVVCGREDKVTPPELSRELAALIPGAGLEWIEQAGHQTPIEQPEVLARLLLALVAQAKPGPAQAANPSTKMKDRP